MPDEPIASERVRALSSALLSAAFAVFLGYQLSIAVLARSNLLSARKTVVKALVDLGSERGKIRIGSQPIRHKFQALMRDVLILSKTDYEAEELSEKYGLALLVDP